MTPPPPPPPPPNAAPLSAPASPSLNGHRRPDHVIVVGAGAVGLAVAEALLQQGAAVTVLERERAGAGASSGNAGLITPSLSIPVPGPGVIAESLRWLVNPSGPLWITPSLSRQMLAWVARFLVSCTRRTYDRGLAALQAAAAAAGPAYDRLAERGVGVRLYAHGVMYPAFAQDELAHLVGVAEQLRAAGSREPLDRISASELLELEPSLSDRVLGGLIAPQERSVRPEELVAALYGAVAMRGAEIAEGEPVTGLARQSGGWLVHTPSGSRRADAVVLANGVAAAQLTAGLGRRLPIAAAKGYSRTYAPEPSGPRHCIYLEAPKVAIAAFEDGARASGTLELGARNLSLSARRLAAISAAAAQALPGWRMPPAPRDWAGMRSLTPDGLPLIGALPGADGVYVAAGHATLGITLAPLTGELIADLMLRRTHSPLLAAFAPDRFLGARAASSNHDPRHSDRVPSTPVLRGNHDN